MSNKYFTLATRILYIGYSNILHWLLGCLREILGNFTDYRLYRLINLLIA